MSVEIFYRQGCPYCQKVLGALSHSKNKKWIKFVNIEEEREKFNKFVESTKAKRRTVPVLRVKSKVHLYESDDIIDFVSLLKFE